MKNGKFFFLVSLTLVLLSIPLVSGAWFDDGGTWKWQRQITLTSVSTLDVIRIDVNSGTVSPFNNIFDPTVNDGNTFAFVNCSTGVQAFHQLLYFENDANIGFDVNVGSNTGNICVRYGDDTNTLNTAQPDDTYQFFDDFLDVNSLADPPWISNDGVWTVVNERMQWDSGANGDTISSNMGSSDSYAGGFSMRTQIFNGCGGNCGFGISNNADPTEAVSTADGYEVIQEVTGDFIQIQEIINGNNTGMQITDTVAWSLGDTFEMRRNSSGDFFFLLNNGHVSVLPAGNDTSTTTGQYVYAIHGATNSEQFEFVSFTNTFNDESAKSFGAESEQDSNSIAITVQDEITLAAIAGATIDFNTGTYTTDSAGQITIPLSGIPVDANTQFTINVDVNGDYPDRDFIFDLNQDSDVAATLLMLETVDGRSIEYQLFQPDKTTQITNSIVEFRRNLLSFQGFSSILETDASGKLTAFVQDDANYVLRIFDTVSDVIRDYNGTLVTVKIPLNIVNTSQELTPFSIAVGGLAQTNFSNLTTDTPVQIFSDTIDLYTISVDQNADFFGVSFLTQTLGGQASLTLQPFLTAQTGNLEATVFTINNAQGRVSVPGIRIESRTDVNGSVELIETKFSDGSGQALLHFVQGQLYTLKFFDAAGVLLTTKTIEANDTQYFVFLELVVVDPAPTPGLQFSVDWDPLLGNVIPGTDGNVTFSPILKPFNGTLIDVNVFISHITDANIVLNQVFSINSSSDFNLTFDLNVAGFNDNFPLQVNLQILDSSGIQVETILNKSYSIKGDTFQTATERTKDAVGQFGVTLIMLILATVLTAQMTKRAVGEDTNFAVIPAMFITGIGVFIGWIEFDVWASGVMFAIGIALWSVKK